MNNSNYVNDLLLDLKQLNKLMKKQLMVNNDNAVLLKDIMMDVVSLSGKIQHFVVEFKKSKNSKKINDMMKDQMIHEKVVEQFIPAMVAYSFLLRNDEDDD